jgi:hypothetical protein
VGDHPAIGGGTVTMIRSLDALYLTEAQIAVRVGISEREWAAAAQVLERSGLPKGDPVFNSRRYWPAVKAYLDRRNGLAAHLPEDHPLGPDGEENWT